MISQDQVSEAQSIVRMFSKMADNERTVAQDKSLRTARRTISRAAKEETQRKIRERKAKREIKYRAEAARVVREWRKLVGRSGGGQWSSRSVYVDGKDSGRVRIVFELGESQSMGGLGIFMIRGTGSRPNTALVAARADLARCKADRAAFEARRTARK